MGKSISFWLTKKDMKQLKRLKKILERKKIKLPDIAKIPEYRGKINRSMILRYCLRETLKRLLEEDTANNKLSSDT